MRLVYNSFNASLILSLQEKCKCQVKFQFYKFIQHHELALYKKRKTYSTCLFCCGKVITGNIHAADSNNQRMHSTMQPSSLCKQDTSVIL